MKTSDSVHELFLNYACTAKCPFCYNPPITPELLRLDLSFEQAAASLYAGAKGGARRLNLHGGEVTLRDDLPRILALARKLGFSQTTIVTNGVRLGSPEYCAELQACGATHIRLSVHASRLSLHDEIVGIPGAFERVLAAALNLRRLQMPVGLNFVLIRRNLEDLPAFVERFCLGDGLEDLIVYFPHLRGMMAINQEQDGISYEEAAPWVREAAARLEAAGRREALLLANFPPCVLPELTDRMLDWSHAPAGSAMTHPEGRTEDLSVMKDAQRLPVPACRSCALGGRCLGVEREYLAARGGSEFSALAGDPEGGLCAPS